jgi:hypothetical protein
MRNNKRQRHVKVDLAKSEGWQEDHTNYLKDRQAHIAINLTEP